MQKKLFAPAILFFVFVSFYTAAQTNSIKVTLLGTGGPVPSMERFGPSILVEAGNQKLLFDCGRGAAQRLWQMNIALCKIDALFLTHLHSDHVVGIPDVWLTGYIPAVYGRRASAFQVFGPAGTKDMMENLVKAGQLGKGIEIFETMVKRAGPTGLFSEETDPESNELLGNYRQGFTHIGLINAALTIDSALQKVRPV